MVAGGIVQAVARALSWVTERAPSRIAAARAPSRVAAARASSMEAVIRINITYGRPTEFSIHSSSGAEYYLEAAENSLSRDKIVLILRLFRIQAIEKIKEGGASSSSRVQDPKILERAETQISQDPLPAIEGVNVRGEAFPGEELSVHGYSIHGTTRCNYGWVRHLEDGSVKTIEGAVQTTYLVTADDVESVLAIQVQPLDYQGREGEVVMAYANGKRKITCDPEMKELMKEILSIGHVSYDVLLPVRSFNIWEPAVLEIKREGYTIKCNGQHGVVITDKFQQASTINIAYGRPTEFSIQSPSGAEYYLKPSENSPSRDNIVLILRMFRMQIRIDRAVEKKQGRRGIFFK